MEKIESQKSAWKCPFLQFCRFWPWERHETLKIVEKSRCPRKLEGQNWIYFIFLSIALSSENFRVFIFHFRRFSRLLKGVATTNQSWNDDALWRVLWTGFLKKIDPRNLSCGKFKEIDSQTLSCGFLTKIVVFGKSEKIAKMKNHVMNRIFEENWCLLKFSEKMSKKWKKRLVVAGGSSFLPIEGRKCRQTRRFRRTFFCPLFCLGNPEKYLKSQFL